MKSISQTAAAALALCLFALPKSMAFVPALSTPRSHLPATTSTMATTTSLQLAPSPDIVDTAVSSLIVATIDADIANLSDNEFAPVFMGGIAVMFGGLLSAIFVGMIVNSKDLSANLVADSYAQGADEEEFWKGLSDEEKKKAQEMLRRVRESKGEKVAAVEEEQSQDAKPVEASSSDTVVKDASKPAAPKAEKAVGMFDDYGE